MDVVQRRRLTVNERAESMNVPIGPSTIVSWLVIALSAAAAALSAWADAPDWVPVALAAVAAVQAAVYRATASSQANTLVHEIPAAEVLFKSEV
jgi:hypothetical protein